MSTLPLRGQWMSTGALALGAGLIIAPMIARGSSVVTVGLRIAFAASVVTFLAGSYTASLQGCDLRKWNAARLSQPLFSLLGMVVLWKLRLLNLESAIWVVGAAVLLQLGWAYHSCQKVALVPGRARIELVRPLSGYGVAQIAAQAPAMLNNYLDQIILSQTVPSADLGRYAIAVSLSMLPFPIISAIGNVVFPRLAAQRQIGTGTQVSATRDHRECSYSGRHSDSARRSFVLDGSICIRQRLSRGRPETSGVKSRSYISRLWIKSLPTSCEVANVQSW